MCKEVGIGMREVPVSSPSRGKILKEKMGEKMNEYRAVCSRVSNDKSKGICEAAQGLSVRLMGIASCREVP